jgi:hypothetical protein
MAQTAVSRIQEFASSIAPRQAPAAMASSTVAPATMAVRRSSAAVAPINGATMNSDITIRPDIAASTQGKSSRKTATAIATCPAGGRVFTPADPLTPDSWASPSTSPSSHLGPAMLRHSIPAIPPARTPPVARSGSAASASTGREVEVSWTSTRS